MANMSVSEIPSDSNNTTEYATVDEIDTTTRSRVSSPRQVRSSQSLRVAASILFLALVVFIVSLIAVPWVQNVQGIGRVIAYSPDERQQSINSPVDGLIRQWFVLEGTLVRKGDSIVDVADIDPDIMNRLERERAATQTKLDAAQKALDTSRKNLDRQKSLVVSGLSSQRAAELAELEYAKYLSEISSASAELARIETRIARQASQSITAPRTGIVQRIFAPQGGVMVKAGQDLALIVPETANRSVELKVSGNDAPLLSVGRKVRLQFEGWPAVQFAGWPSVAIGTFGGEIAVIDPGADPEGNVRIIVFPEQGAEWPDVRYLRQGVRVVGWILLDTVSLGWELWRQFNGFPPTISAAPPSTIETQAQTKK
ncbi:MAG: efflux RND transporter periplasmic adaptor subunit [Pseudomonadota bacterium]|jgi:multidrug efflux pump subunit AcrA (membrane-fusion protein)